MKAVYAFVVVVLSVLLLGCIGQSAPTPAAAPTPVVVEQTKYVCADGKTIVSKLEDCPSVAAATAKPLSKEEMLSVCKGMPESQGNSLEDSCIAGLAAKGKDASLCPEVSRDTRPGCYALVAVQKKDPNVCTEAGSYADRCFEEYARAARDATACEKITEVSAKDNCYNNVFNYLGDPAICEKIVSIGPKDSCYQDAAMRLRDVAYCNKISFADQKQNCLNNIAGSGLKQG